MQLNYLPNDSVYYADATERHGGMGSYPTPVELLAESLASCALITLCLTAEKHGIDSNRFWAEVEDISIDKTTNAVGAINLRLHLTSDVLPENRPRLEAHAKRACTVGNTLNCTRNFVFDYDA